MTCGPEVIWSPQSNESFDLRSHHCVSHFVSQEMRKREVVGTLSCAS